jgi:hypothetical protein
LNRFGSPGELIVDDVVGDFDQKAKRDVRMRIFPPGRFVPLQELRQYFGGEDQNITASGKP